MKLTRTEKENLYIKKMTELQIRWKNPIDGDWKFIKEWTDEELDKSIKDTISQLKFEKTTGFVGLVFKILIGGFVLLGVIGLLTFGIKQLFN